MTPREDVLASHEVKAAGMVPCAHQSFYTAVNAQRMNALFAGMVPCAHQSFYQVQRDRHQQPRKFHRLEVRTGGGCG